MSAAAAPAAASGGGVQIVFPGDGVTLKGSVVRLGDGLVKPTTVAATANGGTAATDQVCATRAGVVQKSTAQGRIWVENVQRRYLPHIDDMVIGTIVDKMGENYRLDIGGPELATLPALAFEGATKRNRPNLRVGALVYCRVQFCHAALEPELTCISPYSSKDWVTGASLFGELSGGFSFTCSLSLCRQLLFGVQTVATSTNSSTNSTSNNSASAPATSVLDVCGRFISYEIAIGLNGRVWIRSSGVMPTIILYNAIVNSEHMSHDAMVTMVEQLVSQL